MLHSKSANDIPFVGHNLLEAVAHASVEVLAWHRHPTLDLPAHLALDILVQLGTITSAYTLVLTTSSGYMTRISETPATAPAAN